VRRRAPRTLAISQRRSPDGGDLPAWARSAAAAGVDAIQIREKDLDVRRLLELSQVVRDVLGSATLLLINGRLDVAVASGASGAHLPSDGLPLARARRRFPTLVLGVSTHRRDEVVAARDAGADYVVFGPVFAPTSKTSIAEPVGLEQLAAVASLGVPVLALGGITVDRLHDVAAAGAAGVAAIGAFQPPHDAAAFVTAAHRLFAVPAASAPAAPGGQR
jgi:thiamine-phosphate pyrophosphorylase